MAAFNSRTEKGRSMAEQAAGGASERALLGHVGGAVDSSLQHSSAASFKELSLYLLHHI